MRFERRCRLFSLPLLGLLLCSGVGAAPVAVNDVGNYTNPGATVSIDVLANDSGQNIQIVDFTWGKGRVEQVGDQLWYTAATSFIGGDTFDYTITDSSGGQSTATVVVFSNAAPSGLAFPTAE